MSDTSHLLDQIEQAVVEHGGDLGGWTRQVDEALQLFDGRVTLRAEMNDAGTNLDEGVVHVHVFTTLHDHEDEVLDACLFGMGDDHDAALSQAAALWVTCVAGPIKSFIDGTPVCMTCQAGVEGGDEEAGYSRGDYGLPGLRAYVGPCISRGFGEDQSQSEFDDTKPWFRFAAESAAPRRVHMAKSIVFAEGEKGWRRELEIDGHDVSHQDPDWPAEAHGPNFAYATRFAVFEFPRNSAEIRRRAELERTIRHFAENYAANESIDRLKEAMVDQGFDAALVHEVESISTIAFGRALFESHGVQYSNMVIRARNDGRVEMNVPLMSIPAYSRARALSVQLAETMPSDDFQALCLYNAESQALLQILESNDEFDLADAQLFPCVVPDRDVSDQTMSAAMAKLNELVERRPLPEGEAMTPKKPWWKFW